MIKIISGHSERGGSTTVFIELTNAFNKIGLNCTFFGPHSYHLDKCKSGNIVNATFEPDDIFITHFLRLKQRPPVKRVVLACHEKSLFDFSKVKHYWDEAVFINKAHREYHSNYNGPYSIIPNLVSRLNKPDKKEVENIAAVIGTIDYNKQTHVSIERALKDGCTKVYVYGTITDSVYFKKYVEKFFKNPNVVYKGYEEDKQLIYNSVGRVYHSSLSESDGLVRYECIQTGTKYFGNNATSHPVPTLSNNEIIELWKKTLQLA